MLVRYEYPTAGDLLHLDTKKLGRFRRPDHRVTGDSHQLYDGAGWEFAHVAIDDASRLTLTSLHPGERGFSACRALLRAVRYYRGLGIRFQRVMKDNGACYHYH